jgi:hypothetical protein
MRSCMGYEEQQREQRQRQNQVRRRTAANGLLDEETIVTKFPSAEKTIFNNGDIFARRKAASAGIVDQVDPAFLDTYFASDTDLFPEDIPGLPRQSPTYMPRYKINLYIFVRNISVIIVNF